jgi:predicted RecB family nuclease
MAKPKLTDVPGIGEATADLLAESGIRSVKTLAGVSSEKLAAVRGFGPARAAAVQKAAKGVLGSSEPAKKDRKKKGKKSKKGKKK